VYPDAEGKLNCVAAHYFAAFAVIGSEIKIA